MTIIYFRRQRWAESKLLEEEVARRLEKYLDSELSKLLIERKEEYNAEVKRRVEAERAKVIRRRAEEEERRAREEAEAIRRRDVSFFRFFKYLINMHYFIFLKALRFYFL